MALQPYLLNSKIRKSLENLKTDAPASLFQQDLVVLLLYDHKPAWTSLPGGELLYVKNTETPWLRELSTNNI